jgi:hypothetical protein
VGKGLSFHSKRVCGAGAVIQFKLDMRGEGLSFILAGHVEERLSFIPARYVRRGCISFKLGTRLWRRLSFNSSYNRYGGGGCHSFKPGFGGGAVIQFKLGMCGRGCYSFHLGMWGRGFHSLHMGMW